MRRMLSTMRCSFSFLPLCFLVLFRFLRFLRFLPRTRGRIIQSERFQYDYLQYDLTSNYIILKGRSIRSKYCEVMYIRRYIAHDNIFINTEPKSLVTMRKKNLKSKTTMMMLIYSYMVRICVKNSSSPKRKEKKQQQQHGGEERHQIHHL